MGIVSVTREWSAEEAAIGPQGRTVTVTFGVLTDSLDTTAQEVRRASGIPRRFDPLSEDPTLYADNVRVRRRNGMLWQVLVDYVAQVGGQEQESPLDEPVEIEGDFVSTVEPIDQAYDAGDVTDDEPSVPILNSSLQAPSNPINVEKPDLELRFTRNKPSINHSLLMGYIGAVNKDVFYGFPAGVCKLVACPHRRLRYGNTFYWRVTFIVRVRAALAQVTQTLPGGAPDHIPTTIGGNLRAWFRRVIDQGYMEHLSDDAITHQPIWTAITDEEGEPIRQEVPLDGAGALKPVDDPSIYIEYRTQLHKNFSALGIL